MTAEELRAAAASIVERSTHQQGLAIVVVDRHVLDEVAALIAGAPGRGSGDGRAA